MPIEFEVDKREDYSVLNFSIAGDGILSPSDLNNIQLPKIENKGVIISGRGPVWLFCYLTNELFPESVSWIATYDPRLSGAVVVARYEKSAPAIGEIIKVE